MNFKRFTALIVVIATLASLCVFSMTAMAEETKSVVELTKEDLLLIEKLEALGVISNEYDPAGYVTRRDMAEITARYMLLPVAGKSNALSPFRDVYEDDEAFNSVCALYDLGIISGDEQLRFRPDDYVTYDEAIVFIVSAVGHKAIALREGGYPTGYHRIAIKHGMLKKLSARPGNSTMPLIDVYKMLEAALSAAAVENVYYGDGNASYTFSETDTFLSDVYGIRKYRDIVTGNEYTYIDNPDSDLSREQIAVGMTKRIYETPGYYYDYFLGYTVDYYVKENSDTGVYDMIYMEEIPNKNSVIEIDAEDLLPDKTTFSKIYYEDENEKEKNISISGVDVIYNNKCYIDYVDLEDVLPTSGYIKALDNDDDGVYEVLFVYEYESYAVSAVDTYRERISKDAPFSGQIDLDSSKHKVYIVNAEDNKKLQLSDIKKGDIVSVLESYGTEKAVTVYVSNKVVTGKITSYENNLGYLIDGNYYKPSSSVVEGILSLGLSGNFYLDMNDEIVKYQYAETGEESLLAVMSAVNCEVTSFGTEIKARLFTQKGDFIVVDLKEKIRVDGIAYDLEKLSETKALLQKLTNDNTDRELKDYAVTSAYVLKYVTSMDGNVSSIEKGGITGPGHLNIIEEASDGMTTRSGYMLTMNTSSGGKQSAVYNQKGGVIFTAPANGELDDLDEYSVGKATIQTDNIYGDANYTDIETLAAYTFCKTDITTVDVFLFRGMGGVGSKSTTITVIEDITRSIDEDYVERPKLYMGDGQAFLLADNVKIHKNSVSSVMTANDAVTATAPALPVLRKGVVVECSVNTDGNAEEIRIIAEPAIVGGEVILVPAFKDATTFIGTINLANNGARNDNFVVGIVTGVDQENKLMQFVASDTVVDGAVQHLCKTSAAEITVYMSDTGKSAKISANDILPGDKFVTNIKGYNFAPKGIIIFR